MLLIKKLFEHNDANFMKNYAGKIKFKINTHYLRFLLVESNFLTLTLKQIINNYALNLFPP